MLCCGLVVQKDGGRERREAIETDRAVARGVGAGREQEDRVTLLEAGRSLVELLLIHDVCGIAGGARDDHVAPVFAAFAGVFRKVDRVADRFTFRFSKATEAANVEEEPADFVIDGLLADALHLRVDDAGIARERATRFDDDVEVVDVEVVA